MAAEPEAAGLALLGVGVLVVVLHVAQPGLVVVGVGVVVDEEIGVGELQGDAEEVQEFVEDLFVRVVDESLDFGGVGGHGGGLFAAG